MPDETPAPGTDRSPRGAARPRRGDRPQHRQHHRRPGRRHRLSTNDTLKAAITLALGVLLVAVGLRVLVRPPQPKAPTTDPNPPSVGRSFPAGAGGMASNLTTFALYTPALAPIAGAGSPCASKAWPR